MKRLLTTTFFVCFFIGLSAQIINTERLRLNTREEGWAGRISFNLNLIKNTRQITQIGLNGGVEYVKKRHRFLTLSNLLQNRVGDDNLVNNGFQHLRYNFELSPWLISEAFSQVQFNVIQKIRVRALNGGGLRFRVVETDTFSFFLGTTYMFEYEELKDSLSTINRDHRQSSYLSFNYRFNDVFRVEHITYFQPKWLDFGDFRLSSETRLSFQVTEKLAFSISYDFLYDTRPPEDLPTTFYTIRNSLIINL
jgi:hypothetical protein